MITEEGLPERGIITHHLFSAQGQYRWNIVLFSKADACMLASGSDSPGAQRIR